MYAHKYITYTIYTDVHITPNADTYFARFNGSARGDLPHGGLGAWTLQRRLHELDQRTHSNLTPQLASLESMDRKKKGTSSPETMVFTCFYHEIHGGFPVKFSRNRGANDRTWTTTVAGLSEMIRLYFMVR